MCFKGRNKMKERILHLIEEEKICLGMTREQLTALLGQPHDKSITTRSIREPLIWKYTDIEFHWLPTGTLWLVMEAHDPTHHETLLGEKEGRR